MDMDSPFSEYSIKRHLNLVSDLGSSSRPFLRRRSLALSAAAPDLGRGVTPLGRSPSGMGSSRLLPLTLDVGWLLSAVLWRAGSSRLGL